MDVDVDLSMYDDGVDMGFLGCIDDDEEKKLTIVDTEPPTTPRMMLGMWSTCVPRTLVTHSFDSVCRGFHGHGAFLPEKVYESQNVLLYVDGASRTLVSCMTRLEQMRNRGCRCLWYHDVDQPRHVFCIAIHAAYCRWWYMDLSDTTEAASSPPRPWQMLSGVAMDGNTRLCDVYVGPGMTVFGSKETMDVVRKTNGGGGGQGGGGGGGFGPRMDLMLEMHKVQLCVKHHDGHMVYATDMTHALLVKCTQCQREKRAHQTKQQRRARGGGGGGGKGAHRPRRQSSRSKKETEKKL